jgi:hypothetical protein
VLRRPVETTEPKRSSRERAPREALVKIFADGHPVQIVDKRAKPTLRSR